MFPFKSIARYPKFRSTRSKKSPKPEFLRRQAALKKTFRAVCGPNLWESLCFRCKYSIACYSKIGRLMFKKVPKTWVFTKACSTKKVFWAVCGINLWESWCFHWIDCVIPKFRSTCSKKSQKPEFSRKHAALKKRSKMKVLGDLGRTKWRFWESVKRVR